VSLYVVESAFSKVRASEQRAGLEERPRLVRRGAGQQHGGGPVSVRIALVRQPPVSGLAEGSARWTL